MATEDETEEASNHPPTQREELSTGEAGFCAMRHQTAEICELGARGPLDGFRSRSSASLLGAGILFEHETSALTYIRTMGHVARASVDHYLVTMYLEGHSEIEVGARVVSVRPGDVAVADMSVPSRTVVDPSPGGTVARSVTFMLPRGLLAPKWGAADIVPAVIIRGDEAYGRIVRDHMLSVRAHAGGLGLDAAAAVLKTMAELVAGGVRPEVRRETEIARAEADARYVAIKHYIERRIGGQELDIGAICRLFGISRAALYRLFEAEGGVVRYVRRRQLRRALATVMSGMHRHLRISDIAIEHGFAHESAFIRAFRREFGVTPGEIRQDPMASSRRGDWWAWVRGLDAPLAVG